MGSGCRATFRDLAGDVVIRVEDFPTEEVLRELKLESPFDLMGLYHGVSLDKKSVMDLPRGPDMVFLYRRPLLDYWAEGDETLGHLVTHVLVHEIGHHFGLSDADMDAHRDHRSAIEPHSGGCSAPRRRHWLHSGGERGQGDCVKATDLTRAFRT